MADGSRLEGKRLSIWSEDRDQTTLQLDEHKLLEADPPLRWLIDRRLAAPAMPAAYVETFTGDRIVGETVRFVNEHLLTDEPYEEHFIIQLTHSLKAPNATGKGPRTIRVLRRFVRRIVWQPRKRNDYQPSTVFCRDGQRLNFRACRFRDQSLLLLTSDGQQTVPLTNIAEFHAPAADPWDSYLDEVAVLSPNAESLLVQIESTGGLIATASVERMVAQPLGAARNSERWLQGLQPAWSLDPLWIPSDAVWMYRVLDPYEVPLSRIPPDEVRQTAYLSQDVWPWQVNRSAFGRSLYCGGKEFGWGFGVHGATALKFVLPSSAVGLRTSVGIDEAAGEGGCVRAQIYVSDKQPVFESKTLVGSHEVVDTGAIKLPRDGQATRYLTLGMDSAHQRRPRGADPLDVRDFANWLDPIVKLDESDIQHDIPRRLAARSLAWNGWTVSPPDQQGPVWVNEQVRRSNVLRRFQLSTTCVDQPLRLHRQWRRDENDRWFLVVASQQQGRHDGPRLEIRINNRLMTEYVVPFRDPDDPVLPYLAIPLPRTKTEDAKSLITKMEVQQLPSPNTTPVRWHLLAVTREIPTVREIFEDERPENVSSSDVASLLLDEEDKYTGSRSIEIASSNRVSIRLANNVQIREQPQWGQFRYLRFAFSASGTGRICLELNTTNNANAVARYDAGLGAPSYGKAQRVWKKQLTDKWILITRDLYADFGQLDLSGVTLGAPDGLAARFDHIYLARSPHDLDMLKQLRSE